MDDLIRRQDAIDALHSLAHRFEDPEDWCILEGEAEFVVSKLPSAQPEIIRCQDCRWRKDQSGSSAWLPCRAIVTPSDFSCVRAERITDE